MNITELALKNSRVAMLLLAAIVALGVREYINAPINGTPPRPVGKILVISKLPGAGPERVESLITKRLEEAIREIPEVKNIESESRSGVSVITAELKNNVHKDRIAEVRDKLRKKAESVKDEPPSGTLGPEVKYENIGGFYGIILALKSEGVPYSIMGKYAEEIRDELIRMPGAAKVLLGGTQKERVLVVRVNGADSVSLSISLKEGANIIQLGEDVDKKIKKINASLPLGLELVRISSPDRTVAGQVSDLLQTLIQSVLIVMAAVVLFLGFRVGAAVASLIPATMAAALFFMGIFGAGLNNVSLAALIMSLGLSVNNGIVIAKSILVRIRQGESVFNACVNSCKALALPLLISSLTIFSAFIPFFLARTPMSELASPFFYVFSISLICSWILSFVSVPLLAAVLIKAKTNAKPEGKKGKREFSHASRLYNALLLRTLKKPSLVVFFVIALFVVSLLGLSTLPFKLIPDNDRNLTVDVKFPSGTRIEVVKAAVEKIERYIDGHLAADNGQGRGVIDYSSHIGAGPEAYDPGYLKNKPDSSRAHMLLNTASADNEYVMEKLERHCRDNIPGADINVNRPVGPGAAGTPIEIRLFGEDPDKLYEIAEDVKALLRSAPGTKNIRDDWGPKIKRIAVNVDEDKARRAGYFPRTGKNFSPLRAVSIDAERRFAKIRRKNLKRVITVGARLKPGHSASDALKSVKPRLAEKSETWGAGYGWELGGEEENIEDNTRAIFKYSPVSGLLIIILLTLQFNSFRKTLIIMAVIPAGLVGVVFGWAVMKSSVGFFGILGAIALAGILVNDSITLLARVKTERERLPGVGAGEALIKAANHKLRPVLTTAFTTSLGMLPLYFGGGPLWKPPAIALVFGLFFAAAIILLFAPALYAIFFNISFDDRA